MAYDLCAEVDPVTKEHVQSEMRSHLHSFFNYLSRFQALFAILRREHSLKSQSKSTTNLEGQKKGSGWMVCCDKCNHEGCVPVPTEVCNDKWNKVPWQCPQCEEGTCTIVSIIHCALF